MTEVIVGLIVVQIVSLDRKIAQNTRRTVTAMGK